MEFSSETPTGKFQIQEQMFDIPRPFSEGHSITSAEAGVLNQTLAENVRNNMAARVRKAIDEDTFDQGKMQAAIDEYLEEYEFGVRRGRGPSDPVEREALIIAKEEVKRALREGGWKLADIEVSEINRLAEEAVEKNPEITEEAERRIEKRGSISIGPVKSKKPADEEQAA